MTERRIQRRLAAVVSADVVGYSRMMGRDEEGTLVRLKALRAEFLHPKIAEYGGRIVKTTGDGTLIEFPSAVDAVAHAVDVQRGMAERNADQPEDQRIEIRIGVNVGDIIIDEGDIFGDGVNVAARLEALAAPGGICISARVHDYVRGQAGLTFQDLGKQTVKNIEEAVRVFRIIVDAELDRDGKTPRAPLPLPDKPSIAVLPFDNLSGDPEQDYFTDGVVEDIITGLSRIRWLFVIARNSSLFYKHRGVDSRAVGHELGVRYLLEGSVRKAAGRVRITAQLIEAASGTHLWAERYDRAFSDVFELQDDLAQCVVAALEPSLKKAEIERVKRKRPGNLDAYDLYLRAVQRMYEVRPESRVLALEFAEKALDIDPDYAEAHGVAAWCYTRPL